MPPYQLTPQTGDVHFDYAGRHFDLKKGQTYEAPFDDPCQVLGWGLAAQKASEESWTADSVAVLEGLIERCFGPDAEPPAEQDLPPAPTATETLATPVDDARPGEGQPVESLNPPAAKEPGITLAADPPAVYGTTGGSLAQEYFRPLNPMPEEVMVQLLAELGTPPEQIPAMVEAARHNEAPQGRKHPFHGRGDRADPKTAAEPVILFSGQYMLSVTDVEIPSRGFPLQLNRLYHSGAVYFGPWGYNWDHNYNVYLRELGDSGAAVWSGQLREDIYRLRPDGSFDPPPDVPLLLQREISSQIQSYRYVLTDADGTRYIIQRPSNWPLAERIPLVRIEDRYGNAHTLTYDVEGRLTAVTDHAGRQIIFAYGNCGLLEQVSDHTGRVWRYFHDDHVEHLVAITTPITEEHPSGLTTHYEYDRDRVHPALIHNLTRVIDPAGQLVVSNRYGDQPGTDDFGRVVEQEYGAFVAAFHATVLQYVPRVPAAINVPTVRVEMVDQDVLTVSTFNYRGDLLDERFRLARDGSYRLIVRTYRYDEQGRLVEQREPNGLGVLFSYDVDQILPHAHTNLLKVELVSPPTVLASSRAIARYTYEPTFHRVKTIKDEAGATTTFVYDYELGMGQRGDVVRVEHPAVSLPDGQQQTAREEIVLNEFGQVTEHRSAEGRLMRLDYFDSGPAQGYVRRTREGEGDEALTQDFEYDPFGNVSAVTDGLGATTLLTYSPLGMLIRMQRPSVGGMSAEVAYRYGSDGRLRAVDWPRGNFQDSLISDGFIRDEFQFDALGNLRSAVYGANTAEPRRWSFVVTAEGLPLTVTDPLGQTSRTIYDERCLPVRITRSVTATERQAITLKYDRNGNLIEEVDPLGRQILYEYDAWDRPSVTRLPGAELTRTRIDVTYGENDLVQRIETVGVVAPDLPMTMLSAIDYDYDERGRVVRVEQGGFRDEHRYDRDGLLVRTQDQRGAITIYGYDSLGRMSSSSDPLDNDIRYTYDARGHIVEVTEAERIPGQPTPEMFHTALDYDARGRLRTAVDSMGHVLAHEYDARDLPTATVSPLGIRREYEYDVVGAMITSRTMGKPGTSLAAHRWGRDRGGRVRWYRDPEGCETRYDFNHDDRWTRITLADGSVRRRSYDPAGEVETETAPDGTTATYGYDAASGLLERVHIDPAPDLLPTADVIYRRDGIGRAVRVVQGEQTVEFQYDQFDRLLSETTNGSTATYMHDDVAGLAELVFPDGRVDRYAFDPLDRVTSITLHQPANSPVTGPTLAAGALIATFEYAGRSRVYRRVLGNGSSTRYTYDRSRRVTGIFHRNGGGDPLALVQYVYNADSYRRVVRQLPGPEVSASLTYDALSRLVAVADGVSVPPPPEDPSQTEADEFVASLAGLPSQITYAYTLDATNARLVSIQSEATGTTTDTYTTNGVHQITQVMRTSPLGSFSSPVTWNADGCRTGDHRFRYIYDAMGRLIEVRDAQDAITFVRRSYDPLGRLITRQSGSGPLERLRYLGPYMIQENLDSGAPHRQLVTGLHIDELVLVSEASVNRWGHQDGVLSLVAWTDDQGKPGARYSYSPFGSATVVAGDGVTPLAAHQAGIGPLFGGHPSLGAPGLYDARARVYDAETGLFLQRDPATYIDSACLYTYVHHNPVNLIDPTGAYAETAWDIFSIGVGAASLWHNAREGRTGLAAIDAVGVLIDAFAMVLPIPGGVGPAIRAYRQGQRVLQAGEKAFKWERGIRVSQIGVQSGQVTQGIMASGDAFRRREYGWGAFYAGGAWLGVRGVAGKIHADLLLDRHPIRTVYTIQGNANDILDFNGGGRIWGLTEGSVYGSISPTLSWWRTGLWKGDRPVGRNAIRLRFEGNAAKVFEPHEATGFYSGFIKAIPGQVKGGFGDVRIEKYQNTRWNPEANRFEAVVTQAKRLKGQFGGQPASEAATRLWGRRIGLDVGLGGAIIGTPIAINSGMLASIVDEIVRLRNPPILMGPRFQSSARPLGVGTGC